MKLEKNILNDLKTGKADSLILLLARAIGKLLTGLISSGEKSLSRLIYTTSPLDPYALPAKFTLYPRSFETFGRELRRIWETSDIVFVCIMKLKRIRIKSKFYSIRSRWGEIPRFTGKSPPRIFIFSECSDSPCN